MLSRFVICLIGFFGLSEVFLGNFWDNWAKGQVRYFFYLGFMGEFVNYFGEGGQVYKFWDHILIFLFICIHIKSLGGGGVGVCPPSVLV